MAVEKALERSRPDGGSGRERVEEAGWAALAAFYCATWGMGIGAAGAGRVK